jgi:hypothetical protein
MIKVINKGTGEVLGRISEADLRFLIDHLEEESLDDQDYYLRRETIEGFATSGASPHLMTVLQGGLRSDDAMEIAWERDEGAPGGV